MLQSGIVALLVLSAAVAQDSVNVRRVGTCVIPSVYARGVSVSGDHAYLACVAYAPDTTQGLYVVSIAAPAQPVVVGYCATSGQARAVTVDGDYAFVAGDTAGLRVISVADPANPVELGHCHVPGRAYGVAVGGGYAFVTDIDSGGLRVISVADPANPVEVGYCESPPYARAVTVTGGHAYVVGDSLSIISVSVPSSPVVVGSLNLNSGTGAGVIGNYAFVSEMSFTMRVIRVADPTHPVEIWTGPARGADGVVVVGSRAFLAAVDRGLRVLNVSDPAHPIEVGYFDIGVPCASGLDVVGDNAYVAFDDAGLQILQFYGAGVEENSEPQAASLKLVSTVIRGLPVGAAAFDAMGRRVLKPRSGVLFVLDRPAPSGEPPAAVGVRKVIVSR